MRQIFPAAVLATALAACNSGPSVTAENASIAEVAQATRNAVKFQPGQWETKVAFVSAEAPGLPPQAADMMTKQMAGASDRTLSSCMTQAMADKPSGEMFGGNDGGQCRYERFAMSGGRIDALMVCAGAPGQPGQMRMTTTGSFTATSYDMASEMKMAVPGVGDGGMTIKTKVTGKRTGDCVATKS